MTKLFRFCVLVGFPGLFSMAVHAAPEGDYQPALASAQAWLVQGDNARAYSHLKTAELAYSGNPEFDYWLGVAALRADEPTHALIALDRAVLRRPTHAGARMERVAALLQLDQIGAAEREIEQLKALSPPPEAQEGIRRFERAIEQRHQAENESQHRTLVGVDLGYDSNPQRFPNEITIDPPIRFLEAIEQLRAQADELGLEIDEDTLPQPQVFGRDASAYQRLQGSYQGSFPIDENSRWLLGTTGQTQRYTEETAKNYDLTVAQTRIGYQRDLENQRTLTLSGSALQGWSGRDQNRLLTRWSSAVEVSHPVWQDSDLKWQLDAQHNRFESSVNDYDASYAGIRLTTRHASVQTRFNAQVGQEWADQDRDGGDLLHALLGVTIDYPLSEQHLIRTDFSHRLRHYQDSGFAFYNGFEPTTRRDRIWEARLAWLYQFNTAWLLETSIDLERRLSSVEFFDTSRQQSQLALRYLF